MLCGRRQIAPGWRPIYLTATTIVDDRAREWRRHHFLACALDWLRIATELGFKFYELVECIDVSNA
jgi:hypothetical protein